MYFEISEASQCRKRLQTLTFAAFLAFSCREPTVVSQKTDAAIPPPDAAPSFFTVITPQENIENIPSAWTMLLRRDQALARRKASALVQGILFRYQGELRLADMHLGEGALSIAVDVPPQALTKLSLPRHVILRGAWHWSNDAWIWQATQGQDVAWATQPPAPMRAIVAPLPKKVTTPSRVPRTRSTMVFFVHKRGQRVFDGWLISDTPQGEPTAHLLLPGERDSYGDQSRPSKQERWQLVQGPAYWVQIAPHRPVKEGSLPYLKARTAPRQVLANTSK